MIALPVFSVVAPFHDVTVNLLALIDDEKVNEVEADS